MHAVTDPTAELVAAAGEPGRPAYQPYPVTVSAVGVQVDATEIARSVLLGLAAAITTRCMTDPDLRTVAFTPDPLVLLRQLADVLWAEEDATERGQSDRALHAARAAEDITGQLLSAAQAGDPLPFGVVLSEEHAVQLGADLLVGADEHGVLARALYVPCPDCGHQLKSRHTSVGCLEEPAGVRCGCTTAPAR